MERETIMAWAQSKMKHTEDEPAGKGYRYYHGLRTAQIARLLATTIGLEVNEDVLFMGALLHDVGKANFNGPSHGPKGAELIAEEISHLFSTGELDLVSAIVANHYMRPLSKHYLGKEKPHFSNEVLLVQDADLLDHFGYNGIWLSHHWSSFLGRTPQSAIDYLLWDTEELEWQQHAHQSLNFDLSRQEMGHRLERTASFVAMWQREERGELTLLLP
ncbi:MAG: HD domain-containing protein [bacterium]|nr:HD domain-containing protein [bacterium]